MYCVVRLSSQPFLANSGSSYGPIMMTLKELLCVLTSFSIAARRSPSVYVANLTLMPGFAFSNTDSVSGIICPVISGFDTTATVTVPVALPLEPAPVAPVLLEPPPLEQAAAVVTRAIAHPAIASLRLERENRDELMYMNLHREDVLGAARRRPLPRYAHLSGTCSNEPLTLTLNAQLGNVNKSCKYEICALR